MRENDKEEIIKHIYVDESRISGRSRYQLFGSFWIPGNKLKDFRDGFWKIWDKEFPTRNSELKWTKVSKRKLGAYKKFIEHFSTFPEVNLRCLVLDSHSLDYKKYHNGDKELGFYKFLHIFLSRNIEKDYHYREERSKFQVFLDRRRMADEVEVGRLSDLKLFLNRRLSRSCFEISSPCVRNVEALDSKESPEVQIVDLIIGAIGYSWEGYDTSEPKLELAGYIEEMLGLALNKSTPYLTERLNIWEFQLKEKGAPSPTSSEED